MALTAAEKQKRYRESKRNKSVTKSNGNAPVTHDGNAPPEQQLAPGSSRSIGISHTVAEGKVYGRQAVAYIGLGEPWDTRPQPLDPLDCPQVGNRGRYVRLDGTLYQFDACGKAFEAKPMEAQA